METIEYKEEVIEITVPNGQTGAVHEEGTETDGSLIIGAVIYHDALSVNSSMVNASLMINGKPISKNQHIDNYRSREASYLEGFKPVIHTESGKKVRFEIRANSAFTADFKAQLILIKEKRKNC